MNNKIIDALDDLYRKGMIVKTLDASGQPLLREGCQVYKHAYCATAAELAFQRKENLLNAEPDTKVIQ